MVVIALLGALAVGLLAAIDPIEQLRKGGDTTTRNLVEEFYNASTRYYGLNNKFPTGMTTTSQVLSTITSNAVVDLKAAGELKSNFENVGGANLDKVYVSTVTTAGSEAITVCYSPTSKSFQLDKNTRYLDSAGATPSTTCKSAPGGTVICYWCIK